MPGLPGYMVAIVVTLGGYLAGLHWLVSPPDPWQSNPTTAQLWQQTPRKRLPPVVTPAEASATPSASAEPDARLAGLETSAPAPNGVQTTRLTLEPAGIVRREVSPPKIRPGRHNRAEKAASRKLEMMVLRTYKRSDGKRFTRLLPMNSARSALAYQPDDQW